MLAMMTHDEGFITLIRQSKKSKRINQSQYRKFHRRTTHSEHSTVLVLANLIRRWRDSLKSERSRSFFRRLILADVESRVNARGMRNGKWVSAKRWRLALSLPSLGACANWQLFPILRLPVYTQRPHAYAYWKLLRKFLDRVRADSRDSVPPAGQQRRVYLLGTPGRVSLHSSPSRVSPEKPRRHLRVSAGCPCKLTNQRRALCLDLFSAPGFPKIAVAQSEFIRSEFFFPFDFP